MIAILAMCVVPIDDAWCQQGFSVKPVADINRQNDFARRLEKVFLETGMSPDVYIYQGRLTIFMPISKSMVYRFITKGKLLQQAYDLGFKGLDFKQNYGQQYLFHFSDGILQCDAVRKVCL
jgi:hypothetical protein